MIQKVSVENSKQKYTPQNKRDVSDRSPSFTGLERLGEWAIKGMQRCEAEPMINVTVLDLATAIIPRTIVETTAASKVKDENGNPVLDENGKQKRKFNFLAGFEALRRESSGLFINCLLPGVFVIGVAKLIGGKIMGKKSNLTKNWADRETLSTINSFYKGTGKDNYSSMIKNMFLDLKGVDGTQIDKAFLEIYNKEPQTFDAIFENLGKMADSEKIDKKVLQKAVDNIIEKTRISENIKFTTNNPQNKYFGNSLDSLLRNTVEVLHDAKNAGITTAEEFAKYITKAQKLVKYKSLGGMAITIPLALAAQPINRWITHKTAGGKKGAPIYNDDKERVLTQEEKNKLLKQKFISIGSMLGLSWTSMMFKIPSMKMLEFKKFFPTMDQTRLVSTATFASRMGASEDSNDLREATVRDLATFGSFYFFGDFAAKGIASFLEKRFPDIKLINDLKPIDREKANIFQKIWHWTKDTALKSTSELTSKRAQNLRSICQLGNLTFSLIALGVFIPIYNSVKTNQKTQKEKAKTNDTQKILTNTADKNSSTGTTASQASNKTNEAPTSAAGAAGSSGTNSQTATASGSAKTTLNPADLIKSTAFGAFFNS